MAARSRNSAQSRAASSHKRLGVETPRIWTPPLRELTRKTTLGYECIDFAEQVMGWTLFPWQRWLLIHMLELTPDGLLRFRTVVVLVARQNGKSTLSVVLSLFFMYVLARDLVIGTAQDLDLAEEIWAQAVEVVEETPELADSLRNVSKAAGKKSLNLTTGQRYKVKAANRRAGRGLSGDLILLDELREHQTWEAWGAITKTTMARAFALIVALSNAGDDASLVLHYLRKMAHLALGDPDGINKIDDPESALAGEVDPDEMGLAAESLGIFEWSAVPGCSKWDRDGWAQANPSLGYSITERTIAAACATDPDWVFRTEVLCQWSEGVRSGPFPPGSWNAGIDSESSIPDDAPVVFGLDVTVDRSMTYIAVAGKRADGLPHVEVVAQRSGTDWARGWFAERASSEHPLSVVVQARGAAASSLIDELGAVEGLTVVPLGGSDLGNSTGILFDLVRASGLKERDGGKPVREGLCHLPQPVLDTAAMQAVPKILDGGGMTWDRKRSPAVAASLMAVTGALWGLMQDKSAKRSFYEDHDLVFV